MSTEEIIKSIAFDRIRKIPSRIKKELIVNFGTPKDIFDSVYTSVNIGKFFGPAVEEILKNAPLTMEMEREVIEAGQRGIEIIDYTSPKYPFLLKQIDDPPFILYKLGKDIPQDKLFIAIVGSRKATQYGLDYARRISMELTGAGVCIVSGMAHGIDSAAHSGCVDNGGHTIAVLGSGLCDPYPRSNKRIFEEISRCGTILSEFSLHQEPWAQNFPRRNRIVSGLSHGVFVAEAALRSGARITSRLALEQNRDVFALSGRADSPGSEGVNELIKRGLAKLVTRAQDILEEYENKKELFSFEKPAQSCINAQFSDEEIKVLDSLGVGQQIGIDALEDTSGLNYERLLDIILNLELKGVVRRKPGNMLQRER